MKILFPLVVVLSLSVGCGRKTYGPNVYKKTPANSQSPSQSKETAPEEEISPQINKNASPRSVGELVKYSLDIEGIVRDGLVDLLKSDEADKISNVINLEFTKGQLCGGRYGLTTGAWCSFASTDDQCKLLLDSGGSVGKEAIKDILSFKKIDQFLFGTQFNESFGQRKAATFFNFIPVDVKQPRVSYFECTSGSNKKFSVEDVNSHLGQELLKVK